MDTIIGKTCPYCQTPIKPGAPAVVCSACGMPHHADCWQENGRCTTFGCSGVTADGPQVQAMPPWQRTADDGRTLCPTCGYAMGASDAQCPRCAELRASGYASNISHSEAPVRRPAKTGSILAWVFGIIVLILLIRIYSSSHNRSNDTNQTASTPTASSPATTSGTAAGEERTNSIDGATMVYVPAGEFVMGSSDDDKDAQPDEKPQHTVYLDAYSIYKNDVTVAQYRNFCTATGRAMPRSPDWGWIDTHPIVNVSWDDATAYAAWAGAALPTEAQWEKAARGTDGRIYPWGNDWDATKCSNSVGDNHPGQTSPVGSFPAGASPYGCMDKAGNVWQWCADWYGADYYQHAPSRNPTGPETGYVRVLRGGSWNIYNFAYFFRGAYRNYYYNPHNRWTDVGFRCVSLSPGP